MTQQTQTTPNSQPITRGASFYDLPILSFLLADELSRIEELESKIAPSGGGETVLPLDQID